MNKQTYSISWAREINSYFSKWAMFIERYKDADLGVDKIRKKITKI